MIIMYNKCKDAKSKLNDFNIEITRIKHDFLEI